MDGGVLYTVHMDVNGTNKMGAYHLNHEKGWQGSELDRRGFCEGKRFEHT